MGAGLAPAFRALREHPVEQSGARSRVEAGAAFEDPQLQPVNDQGFQIEVVTERQFLQKAPTQAIQLLVGGERRIERKEMPGDFGEAGIMPKIARMPSNRHSQAFGARAGAWGRRAMPAIRSSSSPIGRRLRGGAIDL